MSLVRKIIVIAAPAALLSLSACATPFTADVARFQVLPPPAGQSFTIQPIDSTLAGSLEFAAYAQLVGDQLVRQGFQPAADPRSASLVVMVDYGVDHGREKITTTPGFGGGWGGYGGFGRGWGGYSGFGYGRFGGWGWGGWGDPFWDYPDVESYTIFTSYLDMNINRTADNQRLFEGHAQARSTTDDLTKLVPSLVTAMFTGFPGRSAENIRITVPPMPKGGQPLPPPRMAPAGA